MSRLSRSILLLAGAGAAIAVARHLARQRAEEIQPFFADAYVAPEPTPAPVAAEEPEPVLAKEPVVAPEPTAVEAPLAEPVLAEEPMAVEHRVVAADDA